MNFETTQTVTETHVQTNLRWDPGYIKSIPGALKLGAGVNSVLRIRIRIQGVKYQPKTTKKNFFTPKTQI